MNLARAGDLFAIPFFFWLVLYFYTKYKKSGLTQEEKVLALFCLVGLIADIYFVFIQKH
jgi:predicted membrane protein